MADNFFQRVGRGFANLFNTIGEWFESESPAEPVPERPTPKPPKKPPQGGPRRQPWDDRRQRLHDQVIEWFPRTPVYRSGTDRVLWWRTWTPERRRRWRRQVAKLDDIWIDLALELTKDEFSDLARSNRDLWYH